MYLLKGIIMTTNIVTNIEETPVGDLLTETENAPAVIEEYFNYLNNKEEVTWKEKARVSFLRDDQIRNINLLKSIGYYVTESEIAEAETMISFYKSLTVRHNPEKPIFHIPMGAEYTG